MKRTCILIGAPVDSGQKREGCLMGPAAYRVAGLARAIAETGNRADDWGDVALPPLRDATCPNPAVHHLAETLGWTEVLAEVAERAMGQGFPIFMGGDHSLSLGSVAGVAEYAKKAGRPLFVLWLDAHSDFHTPLTTESGNLHGTPLAYIAGSDGFDAFPPFPAPVPTDRISRRPSENGRRHLRHACAG